jgi:hypothetical protein
MIVLRLVVIHWLVSHYSCYNPVLLCPLFAYGDFFGALPHTVHNNPNLLTAYHCTIYPACGILPTAPPRVRCPHVTALFSLLPAYHAARHPFLLFLRVLFVPYYNHSFEMSRCDSILTIPIHCIHSGPRPRDRHSEPAGDGCQDVTGSIAFVSNFFAHSMVLAWASSSPSLLLFARMGSALTLHFTLFRFYVCIFLFLSILSCPVRTRSPLPSATFHSHFSFSYFVSFSVFLCDLPVADGVDVHVDVSVRSALPCPAIITAVKIVCVVPYFRTTLCPLALRFL